MSSVKGKLKALAEVAEANEAIAKAQAENWVSLEKKKDISPADITDPEELVHLANIYSSELSDVTLQLAYQVGDRQWAKVSDTCVRARIAVDKLAGAVSKMLLTETKQP